MRRIAIAAAFLFLAVIPLFAAEGTLPFTLELGATLEISGAPKLQSFAAAQANGKWLLIGGKLTGLHTFKNASLSNPVNNFPPSEMNNRAWVIDPVGQQVWSSALPPATGPFLTMTNPAYEQDGDTLYIAGGYGLWPTGTGPGGADNMRTFDTLSAIQVSGAIDAVIAGKPLDAFIAQIHDPRMRITGGELKKLGETFFLIFGQTFDGLYTPGAGGAQTTFSQTYLEQIATFQVGPQLQIINYRTIKTPAVPATGATADTRPFHRRDLTVGPIVTATGAGALAAYGGVFPAGQISAFRKPVYISGPAASQVRIDSYQQFMSQYNCATVPMYSSASKTMYTTFLGGISLYYLFPPTKEVKRDGGIPFIDEVTTLTVTPDGKSSECIAAQTLPALLGAGAVFFAAPAAPRFSNGVLQLDAIESRTLVGWMYGGIRSSSPQTGQGEPTYSSSAAIPIYVTPKASTCTIAAEPVD